VVGTYLEEYFSNSEVIEASRYELKSSIFMEAREVLVVESVDNGRKQITLVDANNKVVVKHCPKPEWDGIASEVVSVEEKSGDGDIEGGA